MRCTNCKYKGNPPEAINCLYCKAVMPICMDKRKLKKFINNLGYGRYYINVYFGSSYVSVTFKSSYIPFEMIPKIRTYLHAKTAYISADINAQVRLEFTS